MNINITIEGVDGKDARQQLLNFLGATGSPSVQIDLKSTPGLVVPDQREVVAEHGEELAAKAVEILNETKPTEEQPKKKRRTQAEIAAEREALEQQSKTGLTSTDETEPGTVEATTEETTPVEEPVKEEPSLAITAEDLTKKAVELGRAGKRDEVLKTLEEKFGGATIAKKDGKPQLQPEQYQAVMDAFNAIG